MGAELREELQLNFSCLYTDYEDQLDEYDILGPECLDGSNRFYEMGCQGRVYDKEACPTI